MERKDRAWRVSRVHAVLKRLTVVKANNSDVENLKLYLTGKALQLLIIAFCELYGMVFHNTEY